MSVSVSETIGKLLLEGYKMLADSCDVCCTVLMQDRRGRVICVQCESASMANSVQPEVRSSGGKMTNGGVNNVSHHEENTVTSQNVTNGSNNNSLNGNTAAALVSCEDVLIKEMQNASISLQKLSQLSHHDIQGKLVYVRYIRECAETIQALKGIKKT